MNCLTFRGICSKRTAKGCDIQMNFTQVQYVVAVKTYRSFSSAAESLFISQPALSKQIRSLEVELGYDLFLRSSRGITLTKEGEIFCRYAQEAIDSWKRFQKQVCYKSNGKYRYLRIGLGSRVYSNGLFEDVVRFFEKHPEFEVTFVTEAGQDFIAGLTAGTLDIALDRYPPQAISSNKSSIVSYDMIRERQCILMARDDPMHTLPSISFADLQGCVMMTGLENSIEDRTLKDICQRYGFSLKRVYRSDSIDTIMRLVRSGQGVVLGPQSFAKYYDVAAVPLLPERYVYLKFICMKEKAVRDDIQIFRNYMLDICRRKCDASMQGHP